jgi:hypothetical protein
MQWATLFADAEFRKDVMQQIVGIYLACDLREVIDGLPYVDG